MSLTDEIAACQECINLDCADRLKTNEKPYVVFEVAEKWLPKGSVNVLFVAESPPWNGEQRYFYNTLKTGKRGGLRKEILKWLGLPSLDSFKNEGYFLIDAIKCRFNKSEKSNVPKQILSKCSNKFLAEEIRSLRPKTIFVLGDSAKKALQGLYVFPDFAEFRSLDVHKVTEDFDEQLSGYRVILCVYPGGTTRGFESNIRRSFSKIL